MDLLLNYTDSLGVDAAFKSLPEPLLPYFKDSDAVPRQLISLWVILVLGGTFTYFAGCTFNFYFLFDRETLKHPKILPNQIRREIVLSLQSLPWTAVVTVPWFFFELRGYSKLQDELTHWWHAPLQMLWFLIFTDCFVYWIHRGFHHPWLYSWLHKPHHTWKITTPYAALAFHYLDGYGQSIPYHVFVYLFPMWKPLYLGMFVFVQLWTISIHDGVYLSDDEIILSAAHHNIHHLEFNYNYGQYTTLWDRIGGSYKKPEKEFKNEMFFDKWRRRKAAAAAGKPLAKGDSAVGLKEE
ncbi:c-5 sterol desaturase [Phlyctochytrium planicorne]|nr:c-5 sterol desaturase [Phlyctochytrium planicorne]